MNLGEKSNIIGKREVILKLLLVFKGQFFQGVKLLVIFSDFHFSDEISGHFGGFERF